MTTSEERRAKGEERGTVDRGRPSTLHPPLPPFSLPSSLILLALLPALGLAACDNAFDPIDNEGTDYFAVFGYLDTRADTQFVRVSPLRKTIEPSGAVPDVQVSSTLLEDDTRVVWRDSLVRLDDGKTGLLFFAPLRVQPGDTYRLDVRGADSGVTEARAQLPPPTPLLLGTPQTFPGGTTTQQLTLSSIRQQPHDIALHYWVRHPDTDEPVDVRLPLFSPGQIRAAGLTLTINLATDRVEVFRSLRVPLPDSSVVLDSLGLEIRELSPEWADPNASVNISNGFGFFGAVSQYVLAWTLDPLEVVRSGFAAP